MVRKQIYISEEDEKRLKKYSAKRHTTEAFLIREALATYFTEPEKEEPHPLDAIIGIAPGLPKDAAINHEYYLYGAPKKRR